MSVSFHPKCYFVPFNAPLNSNSIKFHSFSIFAVFLVIYSQISEVQSPPGNLDGSNENYFKRFNSLTHYRHVKVSFSVGYLISCARTGPSGSAPKSTKKSSSSFKPPFSVSTFIFNKTDPFLNIQINHENQSMQTLA